MHEDRILRLRQFVEWTAQHITGDEKGQAQVFLDRLFQAFGQRGVHEAGASFEFRVKNTKGGTAFADLVWKPKVLIEMKKRGADLAEHLQQAFDYWTRLVPHRPNYVVLCNFDEFRIYDFDVDISEPQDTVLLTELPERYPALAFLFPTDEKPQFRIDRVKVTRAAADKLAAVYNRLADKPAVGPDTAQRFVLQMLVALFSEDIGFLPRGFVSQLLAECTDPPKAFDLLQGLFNAMNTQRGVKGGRFKDVPYFNGGLFAHPAPVELEPDYEAQWLRDAAENDWSHVSPDIFGTLFQHSLGKEERHAFGAHYTAPTDIMKIVKPTIVDPFRDAIASADSLKSLAAVRRRLQSLRVLDPACGSGNFLYIAYREMRRLEVEINSRENELSKRQHPAQMSLSGVSPTQFFGLDILPFAVELAKVTLAIAPKLASDELHTTEPTLPLANLDNNIKRQDALIDDLGNPTSWPPADVIIGNPPFLGAKLLKPAHGPDYVKKLRNAYPEVPGMADYCVYWFRKAHLHVPSCTNVNPLVGRSGLVGTQNIRNNQSRVGGLDQIVTSGTIVEAVDNQPWSGEANVHVSIVNWIKSADPSILPSKRRLWSKVAAASKQRSTKSGASSAKGRADKTYELKCSDVASINAALSNQTDTTDVGSLRCNTNPKRVYQGITPGHDAFVLSPEERTSLIAKDAASGQVIHPYLIGRELLTGDGAPERFLIDFEQRSLIEVQQFRAAFRRIENHVLPDRLKNAEKGKDAAGNERQHHKRFLERWWKLAWDRADMIAEIKKLKRRYIVCSRVTKRPIFIFVHTSIRPGDALQTFLFSDDYSFGILQSGAHSLWFTTKCSKLTERFRYTADTVFDTFPWPQSPTKKQIDAVAVAAVDLRRVRADALTKISGGLRALYRTTELPGLSPLKDAHAALDSAVLAAYGFVAKKDLLAQLLALNKEVADRERRNLEVTAPGIPPAYPNPASLVTLDCIRP